MLKKLYTLFQNQYVIVAALVLITTFGTLFFGFWKDDWISYWAARTLSPLYYTYWYHPAMTIQFALLSFLFPPNSIGWQIVGIFWKIAACFSLMYMVKIWLKRNDVALLAGILFAVSPLGLDAVGWASANVVFIAVTILCLTVTVWFRYLNGEEVARWQLIVYPFICILVDPFRTFPIVLFLLLLVLIYKRMIFRIQKFYLFVIVCCSPILLFIGFKYIPQYVSDTTIIKFVLRNGFNIKEYTSRSYVLANYPSTIGNIVVGAFVRVPEDLSTGIYNRYAFRLSMLFLIVATIFIIWLWCIGHPSRRFIIFFYLWLLVFYIPNYISEIRLTMGATHRYTAIASIGWIALCALFLSSISSKKIKYISIVLLCTSSFFASFQWIHDALPYRSRSLLNSIIDTVDRTLPDNTQGVFFGFSGKHPIIQNNLIYASGALLSVRRLTLNPQTFPIMSNNLLEIRPYTCGPWMQNVYRDVPRRMEKLDTDKIYMYEINSSGTIQDISHQVRKKILEIECAR
jgi:hypothetical protein